MRLVEPRGSKTHLTWNDDVDPLLCKIQSQPADSWFHRSLRGDARNATTSRFCTAFEDREATTGGLLSKRPYPAQLVARTQGTGPIQSVRVRLTLVRHRCLWATYVASLACHASWMELLFLATACRWIRCSAVSFSLSTSERRRPMRGDHDVTSLLPATTVGENTSLICDASMLDRLQFGARLTT